MMSTASIIVICVAIFTSVTAPLLIAHRTERMHRDDREADWARQDEVAAKAAEAANELLSSQRRVAAQAAEAAALLLANNERVAATQSETNSKLSIIHTLVNSNMTTAMQSEYDAIVRELALMKEVMALNQAEGRQPTTASLSAIEATEAKIKELAAALEDRAHAARRAETPRETPSGETGA